MYYLLNFIPVPFMLLLPYMDVFGVYYGYETVMYFIVPIYLLIINYFFLKNPKYMKTVLSIEVSRFHMISVYLLYYLLKMLMMVFFLEGDIVEYIQLMFLWFFVDAVPPLFVLLIGSIFINPDR